MLLALLPYAVFFLVPPLFWVLIAAVTQRGRSRVFSAVVSGSDGRLSLSRMQAFAWTLLVLGSFCAAMVAREWPWVENVSKEEAAAREAEAKAANANITATKTALAAAEADRVTKKAELEDADAVLRETTDAEAKKQKQADVTAKASAHATAERKVKRLNEQLKNAKKPTDDANERFRKIQWVKIPNELLALAGISLATGVFASVISASNDNSGKPPRVHTISSQPAANLPAGSLPATRNPVVEITGVDFGDSGEVRVNGKYVRALFWDPKQIWIDFDPVAQIETVTVDAAGGKVSYEASGAMGLTPIVILETRDLFREDTNPDMFSMTKFQMFAWTIVAIVFYGAVMLRSLGGGWIETLPVVDSTVVMLTGLSAGGYLGGKAAANMK